MGFFRKLASGFGARVLDRYSSKWQESKTSAEQTREPTQLTRLLREMDAVNKRRSHVDIIAEINAPTIEELFKRLEERSREVMGSYSQAPAHSSHNVAVAQQLQEVQGAMTAVSSALRDLDTHYRTACDNARKAISRSEDSEFEKHLWRVQGLKRLIAERDALQERRQRF